MGNFCRKRTNDLRCGCGDIRRLFDQREGPGDKPVWTITAVVFAVAIGGAISYYRYALVWSRRWKGNTQRYARTGDPGAVPKVGSYTLLALS